MNEVVERVKKAILKAADEAAQMEGEYCSPAMAEAAARAAIEAMREPSDEMRMRGVEALGKRKQQLAERHFRGAGQEREFAVMLLSDASMTDAVWSAMVDELLRD